MRRVFAAAALLLALLSPASAQSEAGEARAELDAGTRQYKEGNFAEARRHFERALELDPANRNAPVFIARSIQQQFKPGVDTPENRAKGIEAVEAYRRILSGDPENDDAYRAVVFLYRQLKDEEREREVLELRSENMSLPPAKRAEALTVLASRQWDCSYRITEEKANKEITERDGRVVIQYRRPADLSLQAKAHLCASKGLELAERAAALAPDNRNVLSYKANLLREMSKLAEMDGDAARHEDYLRQSEQVLEKHRQLTEGHGGAQQPAEAAAPREASEGPNQPDPSEPVAMPHTTLVAAPNVDSPQADGDVPPPPPPPTPTPAPGPAADAPGRATVASGFRSGEVVSLPQPVYPPEARPARAAGPVRVRVELDGEGRVVSAKAVSGHPALLAAAEAAARQARFRPRLVGGRPVRVTRTITYNFALQ